MESKVCALGCTPNRPPDGRSETNYPHLQGLTTNTVERRSKVMLSHENKAIVRRFMEAYNNREFEIFEETGSRGLLRPRL